MWGPQRPKFWILAQDFGFWGFWGFWILDLGDFGFWILDFGDFGFWISGILDFGFWILGILDFGFWGRNPKSKIPQSKIQNPNFFGRFWGFWILDFGPLCSKSLCGPKFRGFWILDFGDFGFWILDSGDFGFWILGILDLGFWIWGILDFGFWGFWILDFGPLCSKSLCEAPNAPNLGDFGFWILGILGILDFGDFGFWILVFGDFGFWILDFVTNFGCYIRKEDCARRTGSADFETCFGCHCFHFSEGARLSFWMVFPSKTSTSRMLSGAWAIFGSGRTFWIHKMRRSVRCPQCSMFCGRIY